MLADRVRMGSKIESGVRFLFYFDVLFNPYAMTQIKNIEGEILAEWPAGSYGRDTSGGYFNCEIGVDYILDTTGGVITPGAYVEYNNRGKSFTVMQRGSYKGSPAFMTIPRFDHTEGGLKFRIDYLPDDWDGVSPFVFYVKEQD